MNDEVINLQQRKLEMLEREQQEAFKKTTIIETKMDCLVEKVDDLKTHLNKQDDVLRRLDSAETNRQEFRAKLKRSLFWVAGGLGGATAIIKFAWNSLIHIIR